MTFGLQLLELCAPRFLWLDRCALYFVISCVNSLKRSRLYLSICSLHCTSFIGQIGLP